MDNPAFLFLPVAVASLLLYQYRVRLLERPNGVLIYRAIATGLLVIAAAVLFFTAYGSGYQAGADAAQRDNRADARHRAMTS